MLADSHCHFDFKEFDSDRDQVWQRCRSLTIRHMLIPGCTPPQWAAARRLCRRFEGLRYAAGLHPWWVDDFLPTDALRHRRQVLEGLKQSIARELAHTHCVAIGECGLDKPKSMTQSRLDDQLFSAQLDVFRAHVELACELKRPIVIHSVKAHDDILRVLRALRPSRGGVIHAFSGSAEVADAYWRLGFYLGIGGTITYERAKKTRTAVSKLPLEALLLETDAPSMPLHGRQGLRNSPEYIAQIAIDIASLKDTNAEQVADVTTQNYLRLFTGDD